MRCLVTRQAILVLFYFVSLLNLGVGAGFAMANCDWVGRTITFYQVFFQQGRVVLGKSCIGPQKGHPRMDFFCTVPRPHFLGRALIWPGCFGERILGVFGLYSSSLSKSVGFASLSGKASLVSLSSATLFLRSSQVYFPLEFELREKSGVERKHGGEDGISCLLPCILLLYIQSELLVFSVTPFKIDQNKNQNYSTDKV